MKSSRRSKTTASLKAHAGFDRDLMRRLAWFRYQLRQFLRFSEKAARAAGVTPQQHQLLLGLAGYTGRGWATIGELAEFLQERHNAVVGLVERAARRGLVRKRRGAWDRRLVLVTITARGEAVISRLAKAHQREVDRLKTVLLTTARAAISRAERIPATSARVPPARRARSLLVARRPPAA
jgi:DNA-binding MarR family transcriptional regulator